MKTENTISNEIIIMKTEAERLLLQLNFSRPDSRHLFDLEFDKNKEPKKSKKTITIEKYNKILKHNTVDPMSRTTFIKDKVFFLYLLFFFSSVFEQRGFISP